MTTSEISIIGYNRAPGTYQLAALDKVSVGKARSLSIY